MQLALQQTAKPFATGQKLFN
jgi:hypothetical protein